jgi:hypothetical protein
VCLLIFAGSKSQFVLADMASLFRAFKKRSAIIPDNVPEPNFDSLAEMTNFDTRELRKIFTRFCFLCNEAGYVERIPFVQQAEFAFCPLISMAFEYECRCQKRDDELRAAALGNESDDESGSREHNEQKINAMRSDISTKNLKDGVQFSRFVKILNEFSPKMDLHRKATCNIAYYYT